MKNAPPCPNCSARDWQYPPGDVARVVCGRCDGVYLKGDVEHHARMNPNRQIRTKRGACFAVDHPDVQRGMKTRAGYGDEPPHRNHVENLRWDADQGDAFAIGWMHEHDRRVQQRSVSIKVNTKLETSDPAAFADASLKAAFASAAPARRMFERNYRATWIGPDDEDDAVRYASEGLTAYSRRADGSWSWPTCPACSGDHWRSVSKAGDDVKRVACAYCAAVYTYADLERAGAFKPVQPPAKKVPQVPQVPPVFARLVSIWSKLGDVVTDPTKATRALADALEQVEALAQGKTWERPKPLLMGKFLADLARLEIGYRPCHDKQHMTRGDYVALTGGEASWRTHFDLIDQGIRQREDDLRGAS